LADTATLQARLTAAEEAYHNLQIGCSARVVVDQNGERVEYSAANSAKLAAYINELKRQLGQLDERGAMGVVIC
jgi:hypothetical protein